MEQLPTQTLLLSADDLVVFETDAGGYTHATLQALGVRFGPPWKIRKQLIGRRITWTQYHAAVDGAKTVQQVNREREEQIQPSLF